MFAPAPTQSSHDENSAEKDGLRREKLKKRLIALTPDNIEGVIHKLIVSDEKLHGKILRYQPVYITEMNEVLNSAGYKCAANNLLDYLDRQVSNTVNSGQSGH